MGKVYLDEDILQDIADATRSKTGKQDTMTPAEIPDEIESITSGENITEIYTQSDMDELPCADNYEKLYRYTGTEDKYLNYVYKVDRKLVKSNLIIHDTYFSSETKYQTQSVSIGNCHIGNKLIAFITTRSPLTLSEDWTILGTSDSFSGATSWYQYLTVATKTVESITETLVATQTSVERLYINMVEIPESVSFTFDGFEYNISSGVYNLSNQNGYKIYAGSIVYGASAGFVNYPSYFTYLGSNSTRQGLVYGLATGSVYLQCGGTYTALAIISISDYEEVSHYEYYLDFYKFETNISAITNSNYNSFRICGLNVCTSALSSLLSHIKIVNHVILPNNNSFNNFFYYDNSIKYVFDIQNTYNVDSMDSMFYNCVNLKYFPYFESLNITSAANAFYNCTSLSDECLNNILLICISAVKISQENKTLAYLGITDAELISRVQNLDNYQDFLSAGWTIN